VVLAKQNEITLQRFKAALEGSKDMTSNRGFRMRGRQMVTYKQQKLGLSAYYDKRWVPAILWISHQFAANALHSNPMTLTHFKIVGVSQVKKYSKISSY